MYCRLSKNAIGRLENNKSLYNKLSADFYSYKYCDAMSKLLDC